MRGRNETEQQRTDFEAWRKGMGKDGFDAFDIWQAAIENETDPNTGETPYALGYAAGWSAHSRKQRGEPVGYFQNVNSFNGRKPSYEQVPDGAKNDTDVFPLYAAPHPAEPVKSAQQSTYVTPLAWVNETDLPADYPYDALYPYSEMYNGKRRFPIYGPHSGLQLKENHD